MQRRPYRATSLILAVAFAVAGLAGDPLGTNFLIPQAHAQESSRDGYIEQNEGKFEEWGKKVDTFAATAAERGGEAKEATKQELDKAWADTKAGWAKLKNASKEGWNDAKSAFEKSRQKLERAWDDAQVQPRSLTRKE